MNKRPFALMATASLAFLAPAVAVPQASHDANQLDLQTIVHKVETDTHARQERLDRFSIQFVGGSENVYKVADVKEVAERGKRELLTEFDAKNLSGLKAYVEIYYPAIELAQLRGQNDQVVTTESSAEELFNKISSFLLRLKTIERLALGLKLLSTPGGASFEIWPVGNEKARTPAFTNQELTLYRGLYKYRVRKAGFKTVEYTLNLVDQTGNALECTLNRGEDEEGPYPCLLK